MQIKEFVDSFKIEEIETVQVLIEDELVYSYKSVNGLSYDDNSDLLIISCDEGVSVYVMSSIIGFSIEKKKAEEQPPVRIDELNNPNNVIELIPRE